MAESLRTVGRYELLEVIGRGGTAIVYLANQPDLDRRVALKELSPHHAGDPSFAERFVAESRLIGAMNHPNIVTVHEFFEDDGLPYIAMEYLPRGSLRPYLATLTQAQIFGVAEDVLAGLAHGESHHTIHRDLKPENLLVTADGHVKISDYGVARALDTVIPRAFATMTGTTIGTPAYMAPEQALGEAIGPQADLYSFGIILWEALAGRQPFISVDTPMAVLYQQVHEPAPPISTLVPDIDPGLARWLDVILAKKPAERFDSASAAWEELEEVAINLLGPRWRREARIDIEVSSDLRVDTDGAAQIAQIADTRQDGPTPSTPAQVVPPMRRRDDVANLAGASPGVTPSSSPAASSSGDVIAPVSGMQTLQRNSRRHDEAEEAAPETAAPSRRWMLWLALAVAVLVAAGAGVGVGVATTPGAKTLPATTETTPAVALASDVRPLLAALSNRRAAGAKKLGAAKTGAAQAAAAKVLQTDYDSSKTALAKLPVAERTLAAEKQLKNALNTVAVDWEKAAYAAREKKVSAYDAERSAITRDSTRLVRAAAAAEKG